MRWQEAGGILADVIDNRERPRRKYDFDEFNAASLARFLETVPRPGTCWTGTKLNGENMISFPSSIDAEQMKCPQGCTAGSMRSLCSISRSMVWVPPLFLVLDMLQREWAAYPERFRELPEGEDTAFLERRVSRVPVNASCPYCGLVEEGLQLLSDLGRPGSSYRPVDKDVDAYNAEALQAFAPLEEEDVWKKYESTRVALMEALSHLPVTVYEHKQVQDWLKLDVIEHYFEHAV